MRPHHDIITRHIAYCWLRGMTIRETRHSVKACYNRDVDFELVRKRFVIHADEWLGTRSMRAA